MLHHRRLTRRSFVQGISAAAVAAPCVIRSSALGLNGNVAPSNRVALGCIGVGMRGRFNMQRLAHFGGQIVAICDVKAGMREPVRAQCRLPTSASHNDFRDLVQRKDVNAVMIATPDHWHVLISMAAIQAGKDVYVEKPLGITVAEGQALRKVVRQSKCVFMHGTEQRGQPEVRKVCELVRNGRIGKLHTITVSTPGGRESPPQPEMPVPPGFDYDLWLGPAPKAPYTAIRTGRVRPDQKITEPWERGFYFITDYCPAGFIGNWGVHHLDIAQWANNSDHTGPVEIEGRATFPKPGGFFDTPLTWHIQYQYANGVKMIFTDTSENPEGFRLEGTDGWILKPHSKPATAHPPSLLSSVIGPNEIHLYETDEDNHCFMECVKSRQQTCSPIEAAHRSSSLGYLGNIAVRLGRKLRWDPAKERFVNDPQADRMLSREMRGPWHL